MTYILSPHLTSIVLQIYVDMTEYLPSSQYQVAVVNTAPVDTKLVVVNESMSSAVLNFTATDEKILAIVSN